MVWAATSAACCPSVLTSTLERKVTVSLPAFVPQNGAYTGGVKGLREFIDWLRETLKGAVQPPRQLQPVPIPVRVRERR